jgi:hypothetical protein
MAVIRIKDFIVIIKTEEEAEAFTKELEELCKKYVTASNEYFYTVDIE